jgi:transposase
MQTYLTAGYFPLERRYDMSTSELHHMQGTIGFTQVGRVSFLKNEIHYSLIAQPKMIRCPCCGSANVVTRGSVYRKFQGVPLETKKFIFLNVKVPKVECKKCGIIRQINVGFADTKKRYTKSFANEAVKLMMGTSIENAAKRLMISWHTANGILQSYIQKKSAKNRFKNVRRIGIDKTYIGKTK